MSTLEWNPAFGPVVSTIIILGSGFYFYALLQRLKLRHGAKNSRLLLLPKITLVVLLVAALLDPDLKVAGWNGPPAKVLIMRDISSSMDLRDDGSSTRADRAEKLIREIESAAPSSIRFQVLPFDATVHEPGYTPKSAAERGTDLAGMFEDLGTDPKLADADGVIVLTDGGDETVELAKLPAQPLGIVGLGGDPDKWSDIGIGNVSAPPSAEENSQFNLEADFYARAGTHADLSKLQATLEEAHGKNWTPLEAQTIDLSSLHAAAIFHVQVNAKGSARYRVSLPRLPGELTYANNQRIVNVQVQQRAVHVLYFTQALGIDYKYLRTELGTDPGVAFTAMYRVLQDQFTVQGDRTGYQDLAAGFPTNEDILKRYDCIILGSFPANQFNDAQAQALLHYVENGGALIFLGGDDSFGRGGYANSKLAPLVPWMIRADEPDLSTGSFPVTISPSAAAVEFTSGWREDLDAAGSTSLDSLNRPGGLRPGAVSLLDATISSHTEPIVAWQHYGRGQVLGLATNTLWKWAAAGAETRLLYGRFWRQTVRGLTEKMEGGALLGIHWNQDSYRPGEQAAVEIRLRGQAGAIRLVSSVAGPDGEKEIPVTPVMGQAGVYAAKVALAQRGDYSFRLSAYSGTALAESYERDFSVEHLLEEGASPELKEAYLRDIAARAGGIYAGERNLVPMTAFLRGRMITAQQSSNAISLVNVFNIFPILIILILLGEWLLRRRFNLI